MFIPLIVVMYHPILKYLLIRSLAFELFWKSLLLSLIPPSYMVAPNRELANKPFFSFSTNTFPSQTNTLPTVDLFNNTGMDFLKGQTPDNNDRVRGRKLSHSSNSSRDNSMLSMASSRPYHEKMEQNNNMDVDSNNNTPSELSYEASQEREIHLRMVAENQEDTLPSQGKLTNDNRFQHVPKKNPDLTPI